MRRLLRLLFVSAFAPALLAQSADISVTLTMPPTAFCNGYRAAAFGTLTLTNPGHVPVQDVTLDLGVLGAFTYPYMGMKCDGPPRPSRCTIPSMVPGSVTLQVGTEWYEMLAAGTVKTTSVTVSSASTPDPDMTNNTASASTTILWQANMTFDALNVPSSVAPGKSAAITASYSNHGPSPATDLSITISIPPGAEYLGYYAEELFDCKEPPVGGHGDLVCTTPAVGGVVPHDFLEAIVGVDPSLAPGTVLPVNAALSSTTAVQSPLTVSKNLTVAAPTPTKAAVSVAASVDQPSVLVNGFVNESYTISNAGPADVDNVVLDLRLPEQLAYPIHDWAKWTLGSCSWTSTMHCTVPTLPAGSMMTLTVPVHVFGAQTFTSTAVVTWLNGDTVAASSSFEGLWVRPVLRRAVRH